MASEAVAGETPQTEKRSLRPRKRSDVATDPQESEDELPQGKRRRSSARSTNGKKKQIGDLAEAEADVAAANGNGNGRSVQIQSNKADDVAAEAKKKSKGKSARSVKAKGKPVADVAKTKKVKKHRTVVTGDVVGLDLEDDADVACQEEEEDEEEHVIEVKSRVAQPRRVLNKKDKKEEASEVFFEGDSLPDSEAKKRWPCRYSRKGAGSNNNANNGAEAEEETKAKKHYLKAKVDNVIYDLGDDVYVKASEGVKNYIGKIIEIFEGTDRKKYFTAQWYFRAEDTVIKAKCAEAIDPRRVFLSEEKNDNELECIVSKVKIVQVKPNINLEEKNKLIPECDLYYDMSYDVIYSSFANLPPRSKEEEKNEVDSGASSSEIISSESNINKENGKLRVFSSEKKSLTLLDLYSGCGGMSTGLCLGAALSGVNLQTLWAVDLNKFACDSLQLNHPKTQVRNEKAENFLKLLKEWEKLCEQYNVKNEHSVYAPGDSEESDDEEEDSEPLADDEFEVQKLMGICWGDPTQLGHEGLRFLVRWKGYGPQHDTWEPVDGLSSAQERIKEFVVSGYKRNILPLPGTADVICGGPPCQGASGFNRFRNKQNPLADEKNQQMIVYMDIVEYLKPKFVLMENVVDILRFSEGFLGRYALSRLVNMNYQARLGLMVAGCYGLAQYRMRVFLWGALPTEVLPQFPLPTHDVIPRGNVPLEFEHHIVALEANADRSGLKRALVLEDVISDLPLVTNYEERTEMDYGADPRTNFQRFIRLSRGDMLDYSYRGENEPEYKLFDHQPLKLSTDDYQRVCQIPKRKGANFRDLTGVKVRPDKTCYIDPDIPRPLLPSGKPLCPDYAISFIKGKSLKPFGRLWWDQTVATVVTRAEPHNQIILHPIQDRVLTIRENARLQGFPDYYRLSGPVKQRYIQVGNAVAVPVGRALGVALGRAACREAGPAEGPVFTLPLTFTDILPTQPGTPSEVAN